MSVGNFALKKGIAAIYTTTGAAGPVYDSISTGYFPSDLLPISAASAVILTLPPAKLTGQAMGGGDAQFLRFANYAAQAVTVVAASGDSIIGSTATIAQNASATFVADSANSRWFRF